MASLIDPTGRPLKGLKDNTQAKAGSIPGGTPLTAPSGYIKDASLTSFAADVLDASMDVPVIVDFWAPWCGPCKQLGPMLERLVTEAKGAVRLVKVNIDENPEIAQQLRIQSIPTVYAFKNGQPVDGFMGAIPESQIKTFVQTLGGAPAGVDQSAEILAAADEAAAAGDISMAAQAYGHLLQEEP